MLNVVFPAPAECRPLIFYLAVEEYLARKCRDDYFMLWQVAPSVIAGRNQDIEAEADIPYCIANGISVFRRKSGGGCVYADQGNLMISAVTGGSDKPFLFERFIGSLALFLRKQGYDAWPSGRNDIMISGKKVSGSAFYSTGSRNVIHATLLCDSDLEAMSHALTPPPGKLASKGIASVRQRVANLSEFSDTDIPGMQRELAAFFCDGEKILTPGELGEIDGIMATYVEKNYAILWKH